MAFHNEARQRNPLMAGWFESSEFRDMVKNFHEKHARFPTQPIRAANAKHEEIMTRIRDYLQRNGICQKLEYTGSSYEEIKTGNSELEFDVMFILRDGGKLKIDSRPKAGYATLTPSQPGEDYLFKQRLEGRKLSSKKTREWFYGQLQKCIDDLRLSQQVVLRAHGPACQLDVNNDRNQFWFSVDVVPAYEVNGDFYVAKPLSGIDDLTTTTTWRRSYSLQEKALVKTIDARDNGCRKQCVRILKAIREKEATFGALQSYFIKTTLMHAHKEGLNWSQEQLGLRLVDMMRRLSAALSREYLEHAFVPGWNILTGYSRPHLMNMATRIDRVLNSQQEMRAILGRL